MNKTREQYYNWRKRWRPSSPVLDYVQELEKEIVRLNEKIEELEKDMTEI